jgi:protein-S-isoprenylcysteine O-methyltransferase Ste14
MAVSCSPALAGYAPGVSRLPSLGSRGEGWVALQGVCFALVAAAYLGAPSVAPGSLTAVLRIAVYGLIVGGAALAIWGVTELRAGRALTPVPRPRSGAELVTSGPYRLVRHPIYGGLLLVALGLALDRPWLGTVVAASLLALVLDLKRRREEVWLAARYSAYPTYREHTKALIPWVW